MEYLPFIKKQDRVDKDEAHTSVKKSAWLKTLAFFAACSASRFDNHFEHYYPLHIH
jgi:hypothetical protein